jgi:hypothetical protein
MSVRWRWLFPEVTTMQRWHTTLLLGLAGALLTGSATSQEKAEVKLEIVKYDGLKNAVLKNRGKVVLIDFWGEF